MTKKLLREYARAFAKLGGKARAAKLSKERRQEISRLGAQIRWGKKIVASNKKTA
jgi:hypothetical protein